MNFLYFFPFLWVFFALLDPDPDPATQSNADPDPQPPTLCRGLVVSVPGAKDKYSQTCSVLEDLTSESNTWRLMGKVNVIRGNIACLKVLTNEKRGGLKVVSFNRPPFKLFTLRFSNKSVQAHPATGLTLLREPCFYYLPTIIVSQYRHRVETSHIIHLFAKTVPYCTSSPIFLMTARIGSPL
jgi:hypothetical protein